MTEEVERYIVELRAWLHSFAEASTNATPSSEPLTHASKRWRYFLPVGKSRLWRTSCFITKTSRNRTIAASCPQRSVCLEAFPFVFVKKVRFRVSP